MFEPPKNTHLLRRRRLLRVPFTHTYSPGWEDFQFVKVLCFDTVCKLNVLYNMFHHFSGQITIIPKPELR